MDHEINKECAVQFERIGATHARIESDLQKLMVAYFGNGKTGLKEEVAQLHRDFVEIRSALYEQDVLLEEIKKSEKERSSDRAKAEEARRAESIKFIFAILAIIVGGMITFANTYFLWRLTGQLP